MIDIIRLNLDLRSSLRRRSRMRVVVLLINRLPPLIVTLLLPLLIILPLLWRGMGLGMIVIIVSLRDLSSVVILVLHCVVHGLILYRLHGLSGCLWAVVVLLRLCVVCLLLRALAGYNGG